MGNSANVISTSPVTKLQDTKCPTPFSCDNLIQVSFSQEVIAESRWTPSHFVFLGIEARLHCR